MPRIQPVNPETAEGKAKELLDVVKQKLGGTPNILTTMAQGPAALDAYLSMSGALAGSTLSAGVREQVALGIAAKNSCDYCAAAHTAIGAGAGVSKDDLSAALVGEASDPKAAAAVQFAQALVEKKGWVTDEDLANARNAGITDGEVMELVAVTALNIFTNYVNHVAGTEIDFPKVEIPAAATA